MAKLAIVTTHPIQYYAPLFKMIAARDEINLKVFYTWSQTEAGPKFDSGFGKTVEWDIPLLDGYDHEFVANLAKDPGAHHFQGIINPNLIDRMENWKPDAILVIGWNYKSHLACLRYFKGKVPVLFRGDSTLLNERPGIRRIARRIFLKWVYRHIDYALYVGERNKQYYLRHGVHLSQLVFAPHAVDNARFSSDEIVLEEKAKMWRTSLGIHPDDLVVLFAAKLEAIKNPLSLIRIAGEPHSNSIKFVVVGNGVLRDAMKSKTIGDERFIFLDFQNQKKMPEVYRVGDIFILPSITETWGLAVNEAFACKRPVIASSKVGCVPDLVKPGVTGWTYESGPEGEMAIHNLLQEVSEQKSLLKRMGIEAFNRVKLYSYEAITENIEKLLSSISAKSVLVGKSKEETQL